MITFAPLRTRRLNVTLRELRMEEIIELLSIPAERMESSTTQFLRFVADRAQAPSTRHVTDPRQMTVQERIRLSTHYISHVSEDGGDFHVGDAKLSSFLMPAAEWDGRPVDLKAEMGGRPCSMWPLLGWQAESLERICKTGGEWLCGAMACQMMFDSDVPVEGHTFSDAEVHEWISTRMQKVNSLAESDFNVAVSAWTEGDFKLTHFFRIAFQFDGVIVLPTEEASKAAEKAGAGEVAPGRFPVDAAISERSKQIFQRPV